ncbi:TPA: hypothetical protein QFT03_004857 [Kluyvera ascorbata]|uniref:hypothetical protein n=1 Tax=Kluyvera georgiana TaxID=73098 RepID=UPI0027FBEAFB|nr:hypothetical protein [Kluyvera ascorbata]HDT6547811.1 hypothetical protein [Kluyvera ascorbata]
MARYRKALYAFCFVLTLALLSGGYYLWQRYYPQSFSCKANLIQHHPGETLSVWLNYVFDGHSGTLSMNGSLESDENKIFNRKIFFRVERDDNRYYLTSERNMKFPDDNINDEWLTKYEPLFFVYSGKSIYMRINEQRNGSYIFTLGSLPTYVCRGTKT